jgi:hypothetical protein
MDVATIQMVATPVASALVPEDVAPASASIDADDPMPSPILVGKTERTSPAASLNALRTISSSSALMLQPINESIAEYPNGTICYQVEIEDGFTLRDYRGVGWATFVYAANKMRHTLMKACLGNYECPSPKCTFHERPRVPRGTKNKKSLPLATDTSCPHHNPHHKAALMHWACDVTLKISHRLVDSFIVIEQCGSHCHGCPHPIRPDVTSCRKFAALVHAAPEVNPKQLQLGNYSRPPMSQLHTSLGNLSRLANERNKGLISVRPTSAIGMLASFERRIGKKMIVRTSIADEDGHIVMITSFQKERLMEAESSLQADSVEGFLVNDYCPAANVTMTTGFCTVVNRHCPCASQSVWASLPNTMRPTLQLSFRPWTCHSQWMVGLVFSLVMRVTFLTRRELDSIWPSAVIAILTKTM